MEVFSTASAQITDSITTLAEAFVDTWNKKDDGQFGELFTDDAEFTDIVGQVARTKSEIIEQHQFPFSVTNKNAVLSLDELHIRTIAPEMVLTSCKWEVMNSSTPDGKQLPPRKGVMQMISKNLNDTWKISLVHNTDLAGAYNKHVDTTLRLFSKR